MNELQKGWPFVPLVEIAKVEWGNTSITKKSYVEDGYTAFSASGPDGFLQQAEWEGQAVVLSAIGARCGKCFFADGKWTAIKNTIVIQGEPDRIDHKFLYYYLNDASKWVTSGSGQPFITLKTARATLVPSPPLDQQKRIVAEIEKQFSRLDEAVANLKRVKANLKRYKAAVLKAAVEGHLVETEAELARREGRTYETGEQLLQRILETRRRQWEGKRKYKEPGAPDTTDLPELPEGWVWATVDQLAAPEPNSITDGPFGSNLKTEHYQASGPRVIRLQNIKDGEFADEYAHISWAHFEQLRKHEIHAGDIVIASLGENPPRACIIPKFVGPAIVKADCIRFKPHSAMEAGYLNAALNCQPTRQRVKCVLHGVGRPRLSLGEIRAIALPIPPEAEQHRIAAEIERRLSLVSVGGTQVDKNFLRTERLRQAILQAAFSKRLQHQPAR